LENAISRCPRAALKDSYAVAIGHVGFTWYRPVWPGRIHPQVQLRWAGMKMSFYGSFACLILAIIGAMYAFSGNTDDSLQLSIARWMAYVFGVLFFVMLFVGIRALRRRAGK
jgi:hypothetical protein